MASSLTGPEACPDPKGNGVTTYARRLGAVPETEQTLGKKSDLILLRLDYGDCWHVDTYLEGIPVEMLIDTGATRSVISKPMYYRLPRVPRLTPTNVRFKAVSGDFLGCIGVCHLTIKIGDRVFTHPFFVAETNEDVNIIGADLMVFANMIINMQHGSINFADQIGGPPVMCKHRGCEGISLLRIVGDTLLYPEESAEIVVALEGRNSSQFLNEPFFVEAHSEAWEKCGVSVHEGLQATDTKTMNITVSNNNLTPVKIKTGVCVAKAVQVDAIETMPATEEEFIEKYGDLLPIDDIGAVQPMGGHHASAVEGSSAVSGVNCGMARSTPPHAPSFKCKAEKLGEEERDASVRLDDPDDCLSPPLDLPKGKPGELPEHVQKCYDGIPEHPEGRKELIYQLLLDHQCVFHSPNQAVQGSDKLPEHRIPLLDPDQQPVKQKLRRFSPAVKEAVETECFKMLDMGYVSPSRSPWASPIVPVRKKDGTMRFCVDYRQLNSLSKKDAFPLPRIDDQLEKLSGAQYFCTLDLYSGYWQIKVAQKDREKTAFVTHVGLFEFNVMPFGLTNAPATFQRMMQEVLGELLDNMCLVYIDDVVVYAKTWDQMLKNLNTVLQRIDEYGLKLKASKCFLFQKSIKFLGHVISGDGIQTDSDKVAAIKDFKVPTRVKHVRSFLGLTGYYRKFIKSYALLAEPLHCLLRANASFRWELAQQQAFDALKDALCQAPVLGFPVHGLPYIVDTDASLVALGGVLSQVQDGQERVIAYGAYTLCKQQRNYCATKRELLAAWYFVVKLWNCYLEGTTFTLRVDHSALKWLKSFKGDAYDLYARWIMGFEKYGDSMKVEHRPGKKHENADAMSRIKRRCKRPDCPDCTGKPEAELNDPGNVSGPECPEPPVTADEDFIHYVVMKRPEPAEVVSLALGSLAMCSAPETAQSQGVYVTTRAQAAKKDEAEHAEETLLGKDSNLVRNFSHDELKAQQSEDASLRQVIGLKSIYGSVKPSPQEVKTLFPDAKKLVYIWPQLHLVNGVLYRQRKDLPSVYCVPRHMITTIMDEMHSSRTAGHPGVTRMVKLIKSRFYWVGMKKDVEHWAQCCKICHLAKRGPGKGKSHLVQDQVSSPFERCAFDVIGPLNTTIRGNRFILVLVDYFSKWAEAYALPNHQAETVAETICAEWIARNGCPIRIRCDRAPEFEGTVISHLFEMLGVCKTRTTPYRPQSNGLCERTNQTIENILKATINANRDDWDEKLPFALMSYRATTQTSTGFSPNQLVFGREAYLPVDLMYPRPYRHLPYLRSNGACYCSYVDYLRRTMTDSFARAKQMMQVAAVRQKRYYDAHAAPRSFNVGDWVYYFHFPTSKKTLSSGWIGPYVVVRKLSEVVYELQKDPKSKPFQVHCDLLRINPINKQMKNWIRDGLREGPPVMVPQGTQTEIKPSSPVKKAYTKPARDLPPRKAKAKRGNKLVHPVSRATLTFTQSGKDLLLNPSFDSKLNVLQNWRDTG